MESRVWYAHDLVVAEKRETKAGESAVAAAARQALESTKMMPMPKSRRRSRAPWVVGAGLVGAAAAAMILPLPEEPAEQQVAAAHDHVASDSVLDPKAPAKAPPVETGSTGSSQERATADRGDAPEDSELTTAPQIAEPEAPASKAQAEEAVPKAAEEQRPGIESRVAGYSAIEATDITTGTATPAADLKASPAAAAPASPSITAGEIPPAASAQEVNTVELHDGSAPAAAAPGDAAAGAAPPASGATETAQRTRRKPARQVDYYDYETGDCAMPHWGWRVLGFTEPANKKKCGG